MREEGVGHVLVEEGLGGDEVERYAVGAMWWRLASKIYFSLCYRALELESTNVWEWAELSTGGRGGRRLLGS